jgi:hypothetical protein
MNDNENVLKIIGINSKGYGNIPKLVMQDRKLTPEAKCIYAYFASYAGSGSVAFPSVSKIIHDLCMSESRYYRHFKLLVNLGYITVEQARSINKFSHNIYILNSEIVPPSTQNEGTVKVVSLYPQNEGSENEGTQNVCTNTNNLKKNSINKRINNKKKKSETKGNKYEKFYL